LQTFLSLWQKNPRMQDLIWFLFIAFLVFLAVRVLQRQLLSKVKDSDNRYRMRKFSSFIGFFIVLMVAILFFSDRFSSLAVVLGVTGAGIAFALQEVITSIAGWMVISVSHFYKTGDRILLGGILGDVIDISILRTTLMELGQWVRGDQYNGRIVRVANSFVFKEPVFNYSADFPFIWDEVIIPIKYGSDHKAARALLQKVADDVVGAYAAYAQEKWKDMVNKYFIEEAKIQPMVLMTASENWMEFAVRYVVDYKARRTTKDLLFSRILDEVDQSGGKVSIAGSSLELTGVPDIHVQVNHDDPP
jgi:small-conductance mechanosensitive channel